MSGEGKWEVGGEGEEGEEGEEGGQGHEEVRREGGCVVGWVWGGAWSK